MRGSSMSTATLSWHVSPAKESSSKRQIELVESPTVLIQQKQSFQEEGLYRRRSLLFHPKAGDYASAYVAVAQRNEATAMWRSCEALR